MPEIGTSGSTSGDGKRSDCTTAQATASILDSTRSIRATRLRANPADIVHFHRYMKLRARPRPGSRRLFGRIEANGKAP